MYRKLCACCIMSENSKGLKNVVEKLKESKVYNMAVLPYFCAKLFYGSKKKVKRLVLVIVFYINCRFHYCYCHPLALAYPYYTFCNHFFCAGDGYNLTADLQDYLID